MNNVLTVNLREAADVNNASLLHLVILKNDIGYDFEVRENNKMIFSLRFLYGQKLHKIAYCLGGAVYGLLNNDALAEVVIKAIEDNKDVLGGYELIR
jgi:hypothetical protein